jgi:type III pantothenate kinase
MIALLDIGNSRVKWQCMSASGALEVGTLPTVQLPDWRPVWAGQCECALVSCVAGDWALDCLSDRLGLSAERIHVLRPAGEAHGIVNRYRQPERLGADRYAGLVAAHRRGLGDCLVVSVGTAVCADMLTAEGRFLGGCILPGPDLMRTSLATGTARVGGGMGEVQAFPCDTEAALATGIALALCGLLDALESRLQATTGRPVTRLVSGGGRAVLAGCLGRSVVEVENLVLEGLAWIARDLGYVG